MHLKSDMHFDVMRQPWINVLGTDGSKHVLGMRELLLNAHKLSAMQDISPLFEYGIYRVLTVMIMNLYQPEELYDLQDLLAEGRLEEKRVDTYISECEKAGNCFDLFDHEMPFLQTAHDPSCDLTRKPIATLFHELPSGNNHVHFEHALAQNHAISYMESAKALCAVNVFCTSGLQGPSSVNGAPPIYVLVKGETLFETILFNCISKASANMEYSSPAPAWRDKRSFVPGQKVAVVSLLEGMTLRARRITLIPADGAVREMYFQKGLNFEGYGAWKDPHTVISEKSGASVKPRQDKDTWRNIGMIFGGKSTSPIVVQQFYNLADRTRISAIAYGLITNQASYESWFREEMVMPTAIANNPAKMQIISEAIALSETIATELRKSLRIIREWESIADQTISFYYAEVRGRFFAQLCSALDSEEPFDQEQAVKANELWKDVLRKELIKAFNTGADRMGSSAQELQNRAKASNRIGRAIAKYLMKGEVKDRVGQKRDTSVL